jgi:hypothetical protein
LRARPLPARGILPQWSVQGDGESGDANEVADFSSRGPTSDGRTKPDIVAPGTWIVSARSAAERVAWQDSVENAVPWNPTAAFSWSDKKARSGNHSWRYVVSSVGSSVERLESPAFSLPPGPPLFFEVALLASRGSSLTVRPYLSTSTHDWEPIKALRVPASDHWVTQSIEIPRFLQGQDQAKLAIEVDAGENPADGAELFLDDFRITSLGSWGPLADSKLAVVDDSTDRSCTFEGGTSMAAPMVAGAAALVREFFQERLATNPSAELLKAVLINGAVRLGAGPWPNSVQGWGRVDLAHSLHPGNGGTLLFQDGIALAEGEVSTMGFAVTDPAELRVTLVWCDPPGGSGRQPPPGPARPERKFVSPSRQRVREEQGQRRRHLDRHTAGRFLAGRCHSHDSRPGRGASTLRPGDLGSGARRLGKQLRSLIQEKTS